MVMIIRLRTLLLTIIHRKGGRSCASLRPRHSYFLYSTKSAKVLFCCGPGCNKTRCTRSVARMFAEHSRELHLTLRVFAVRNIFLELPSIPLRLLTRLGILLGCLQGLAIFFYALLELVFHRAGLVHGLHRRGEYRVLDLLLLTAGNQQTEAAEAC